MLRYTVILHLHIDKEVQNKNEPFTSRCWSYMYTFSSWKLPVINDVLDHFPSRELVETFPLMLLKALDGLFVRKHLFSLLLLSELYPYSLICLFMYQVCGVDVLRSRTDFIIKSLPSLITPRLVPHM